jgi:ribosomal protein L12E/L44/L45/RPP1/RPP2
MNKSSIQNPKPSWMRKTLNAAMDHFFSENCPQLGGEMTRTPIIKELLKLIEEYMPPTERLKMGQLVWYAIDEKETSGYGKSIEKCKIKPVIVNLLEQSDLDDLLAKVPKKERQKKVAARLFEQAHQQGGVFTLSDVGAIMRLSGGTISKYIREYEKEHRVMIPRRGNIHDMGPTVTHKRIICQKYFLEGKSIEEVMRETKHSAGAITRYLNDFKRVRECLKDDWPIERISYTTGLSPSLTKEYIDLIKN